MIPKTIIRETNIPAPPGTDPMKIMAKWIAQLVRDDQAKVAAGKEVLERGCEPASATVFLGAHKQSKHNM